MITKRTELATNYNNAFKDFEEIIIPELSVELVNAWHMYIVKISPSSLRNWLFLWLRERHIEASVHYSPLLHRQPLYSKYTSKSIDYLNSERLEESILTLPLFPDMIPGQQESVIGVLIDGIKPGFCDWNYRTSAIIV